MFRSNRGPIRTARFPRGRFPRRRRPALSWTNNLFDTTIDVDGTLTRLELAAHADFEPAGTTTVAGALRIHRVQFKGVLNFTVDAASEQFADANWLWAMWVEDSDETDSELFGTAGGNLFPQKHFIKWDFLHARLNGDNGELNETLVTKANSWPIKMDLKMRKPITIPFDSHLVIGLQCNTDLSAILSTARVVAVSRLVVQLPGTGR